MIPWGERAPEERAILTPSFLSLLLWKASNGYYQESNKGLPFELAFLILPMVLHSKTRESLPRSKITSLATWIDKNPLIRSYIANRSSLIAPFTKEALLFGGMHGLFKVTSLEVTADTTWARKVKSNLRNADEEIQKCSKSSELIGKWFAKSGSSQIIMSLIGVRP